MAPEIAARIKARLARRRRQQHSPASSSRSAADAQLSLTSLQSQTTTATAATTTSRTSRRGVADGAGPVAVDASTGAAAAAAAAAAPRAAAAAAATTSAACPALLHPRAPPPGGAQQPQHHGQHPEPLPEQPPPGSASPPPPPSPPPPLSQALAPGSHLRSIHEHAKPTPADHCCSQASDDPRHGHGHIHGHVHGHAHHHDKLSVVAPLSAAAPPIPPPPSPTQEAAAAAPPTPGRIPWASAPLDPSDAPRRQSLFASRQTSLIKTLLHSPSDPGPRPSLDVNMVTRKIWVRRPNASATTIIIHEDDLVDDVRDLILRKYANSLGRTFDSPDLNIRICPRDQDKERLLGPEETMARTLDCYYPGGQTVDEALVIDIPRRTPKPSPRAPPPSGTTAAYYLADDGRPSEAGEGYFPPVVAVPSPHLPHAVPVPTNGTVSHSIAVLGTGHIPPIPSPGGGARPRPHRERSDRPRPARQRTSSPTMMPGHPAAPTATNPRLSHSRSHSTSSEHQPGIPTAKTPLAKSPAPVPEPMPARVASPPPRVSSPRPSSAWLKKSKKGPEYSSPTANVLNGTVPPISVLIVEDNPINLKLLEAFVKRLKVRWQTAMNGRDAVKKWRSGGFHLVLMDIQLPVMNGLDATREIRRLERVNSIGIFSLSPSSVPEETSSSGVLQEQDRLENPSLFKSPVIIVALTASSLQSDRHEALAAGCNDFLTKPVNFVWLERKVMEWGCMQALIDFDGWRKWKDFSHQAEGTEPGKKAQATRTRSKKARSSLSSST